MTASCSLAALLLLAAPARAPRGAEADAAFLSRHFADPPAAEVGKAVGWDPVSLSLLPDGCGVCHPAQLADWRGSRHARAVGPGLEAQALPDPAGTDPCSRCHAPLLEQRPAAGGKPGNPAFRRELRSEGLTCPSCHVRGGVVYGPPRKEGTHAPDGPPPHQGFVADEAFLSSSFCATCHQFPAGSGLVAGVPLENTFAEWEASPQAAQGKSCQSCHMPDRRHLFRGIHDPELTASAFTVTLVQTAERTVEYAVTNSGAGHHVPTYITPRLTLVLEGLDPAGNVVRSAETTLQRRVDVALREQAYDTRLTPGATAAVVLDWWPWHDVSSVRSHLRVEPDEFYQRFFEAYRPAEGQPSTLAAEVRSEMSRSGYDVLEQLVELSRD